MSLRDQQEGMMCRRNALDWLPLGTLLVALLLFVPAARAQSHADSAVVMKAAVVENVAHEAVIVSASVAGSALPNHTLTLTAAVEILDGSTLQNISWVQTAGVPAQITGSTVKLSPPWRYKNEMIHLLEEPPIGPQQLPPNVPAPEGEFAGGLQNRFVVVGVDPFTLEETGLVELEARVTTTSGTYTDHVEIDTMLPWRVAGSIGNVPLNRPVVLHGKKQASYDWELTPPSGSGTTLRWPASQDPTFTPDITGLYEIAVTDLGAAEPLTLYVYAGLYRGVIVGQDAAGRPIADQGCTSCHSDTIAQDKFTPWAKTGHAEIFTNNLNTSTHYGSDCFPCHTVGYDPGAVNGGIDEAPDYQAFQNSGLINHPGDNWTTVLDEFPATAQLANIQCENCHGPQNSHPNVGSAAHGGSFIAKGNPRVSLSSSVCAVCHGEPLRHARYQQWQLSGHANYELAIDEGDSGNCSRCHTANGFLTWLPILLGDEPGDPTANISVTWEADDTHPQTCPVCHDPHAIGTTTGIDTNATVRLTPDTPELIAGFSVTAAGRGAICMTCHNSRRGLRNDLSWETYVGTSDSVRAPHGSAQTDVLMGENAYLVDVGARGPHSLVEDTCVVCHMEATPPPADLSYNQGGTNHTFFASEEICNSCHEELTADSLQSAVDAILAHLQGLIEGGWLALVTEQIAEGNAIDLDGEALVTDASAIKELVFGERSGRQSLEFIMESGTTLGPYRINDLEVVRPTPLPALALYDVADEDLMKAGWNWNLVNNDGSHGVHNPRFVLGVLAAARNTFGAVGGPRASPNLLLP